MTDYTVKDVELGASCSAEYESHIGSGHKSSNLDATDSDRYSARTMKPHEEMSKPEKMFMIHQGVQREKQASRLAKGKMVAEIPNRGLAPAEYKYWVIGANFEQKLHILYPEAEIATQSGMTLLLSGYNKIKWCDVWVPHTKAGIWFKSKDEYLRLNAELCDEYAEWVRKNTIARVNAIYKLDVRGQWASAGSYNNAGSFRLIGADHYLETIMNDIRIHQKHMQTLRENGEEKSLNYVLHGPPGVGKTSLIRVLASRFNYPLFIINPNIVQEHMISTVLNPHAAGILPTDIVLVIFEDFDRFIEVTTSGTAGSDAGKSRIMSAILNALDGFDDKSNMVRFFTGNNYEKIAQNKAVINRMAGNFKFDYPTSEVFAEKLKFMLKSKSDVDSAKFVQFIDACAAIPELTLRPFSIYVTRYMFESDYLEKMIANIAELHT